MKFRKTPQSQRGTYTYTYLSGDGKTTEKVVLRPGEDGVTEMDIKSLHSLDDSEVYYNCKNAQSPLTAKEKEELKDWQEKHPNENAPKRYAISLDATYDDEKAFEDKSHIQASLYYEMNRDVSDEVEHLREVVKTMPPKRQEAYQLVCIDGFSKTEAARIMGTSPANITIHINKAIEYIKNNF